jgi:hypothetical protein
MSAIIEPDTFYAGCTAPRKAAWLYTVLVFMSVIIDPDTEGSARPRLQNSTLDALHQVRQHGSTLFWCL